MLPGILSRRLAVEQSAFAIIEEPWCYKAKGKGISQINGSIVYCSTVEEPRTAIYVRRDIEFISLP